MGAYSQVRRGRHRELRRVMDRTRLLPGARLYVAGYDNYNYCYYYHYWLAPVRLS